MARVYERRRAIELRKEGKSFNQIKQEVHVSKSSLSLWLRNYLLSPEQLSLLKNNKAARIEKYRETMKEKRRKKLESYYRNEKRKWLPLSEREVFLAGLFLYWGEGNKAQRHTVSLNNTDPNVVKFALYWINKSLGIPKEKIQVFLHLYDDMNIEDEMNFWSRELNMDKSYFTKPYIKKSRRIDLDQKGFGHGTCGVRVYNTVLKESLLMAIKAIAEVYGEKVKEI